MGHWWRDIDRRRQKYKQKNLSKVPHKTPHEVAWDRKVDSRAED